MNNVDKKMYSYSLLYLISLIITYFILHTQAIDISNLFIAAGVGSVIITSIFVFVQSIILSILFLKKLKIKIIFAWYDFWIGLFYDKNKKILYIFLIPMIGLKIERKQSI
jgi:hypothetical protein